MKKNISVGHDCSTDDIITRIGTTYDTPCKELDPLGSELYLCSPAEGEAWADLVRKTWDELNIAWGRLLQAESYHGVRTQQDKLQGTYNTLNAKWMDLIHDNLENPIARQQVDLARPWVADAYLFTCDVLEAVDAYGPIPESYVPPPTPQPTAPKAKSKKTNWPAWAAAAVMASGLIYLVQTRGARL